MSDLIEGQPVSYWRGFGLGAEHFLRDVTYGPHVVHAAEDREGYHDGYVESWLNYHEE